MFRKSADIVHDDHCGQTLMARQGGDKCTDAIRVARETHLFGSWFDGRHP
jgi:hypothetical protein